MNSRYALLSDAQWELFARLPAMKTLTGFDYSSVRFAEDYGRESLESLDFINRAQDLVLYGDAGTGKTHMASALVAAACRQGIPARASRPGSSRPLPW